MWMRILKLLLDCAGRHGVRQAPSESLTLSFRLLKSLVSIQSEPSAAQPEAESALSALERSFGLLFELAERAAQGASAGAEDWLAMAFLAELAHQLESRWDGFYAPCFAVFEETGAKVTRLRAILEELPLAALLAQVAGAWAPHDDAFADAVVAVLLTACAQRGIRGDERLYANVVKTLTFESPFLFVAMAGYCVRILDSFSLIRVGDMTDEQYACMSLLHNFADMPGGPWS
jgi:hypothetical protein